MISRGIASCAGMTARLVLLSQTKIGFLTARRGKSFRALHIEEQEVQKEEADARATDALTRAQTWCFLMCPLDMKGLIGSATVVGTLQHGGGVCELTEEGTPLLMGLKYGHPRESKNDG